MIGLVMFAVCLLLLLVGFPVAFTFGGAAVIFGLLAEGQSIFAMMPHRIWSVMNNTILMAIPLFIFMGIVLQKSKLAERLLDFVKSVSYLCFRYHRFGDSGFDVSVAGLRSHHQRIEVRDTLPRICRTLQSPRIDVTPIADLPGLYPVALGPPPAPKQVERHHIDDLPLSQAPEVQR